MRNGLVIVAGGSAQRFGSNKLLELLAGVPVFIHSMRNLGEAFNANRRVMVVPQADMESFKELAQKYLPESPFLWVSGGAQRSDSVQAGLNALPHDTDFVAIHDGARPLANSQLLENVLTKAKITGAAIPARAVVDTLKRCNNNNVVIETVSREKLYAVETPQCFDFKRLLNAYKLIGNQNFTDDAGVFEAANGRVTIVENQSDNLKLTYRNELAYLEWLIGRRTP